MYCSRSVERDGGKKTEEGGGRKEGGDCQRKGGWEEAAVADEDMEGLQECRVVHKLYSAGEKEKPVRAVNV